MISNSFDAIGRNKVKFVQPNNNVISSLQSGDWTNNFIWKNGTIPSLTNRGAHFLEANKALNTTMANDSRLASDLGIVIPKSPSGSILGKSPTNWVWHHDVGEGIMQLVPKEQHTVGSRFWSTLHPNGVGGFAIWGK